MLDTLSLVKQLAELTAAHTHQNVSSPLNASSINSIAEQATGLDNKYSAVISK